MKFLIDMNLSPLWEDKLNDAGWETIHWSRVGKPQASDTEIMTWAKMNKHVVFTHDLDFGAILAATKTKCPSVIQIRTQDVNPFHVSETVIYTIKKYFKHLESGALITIDENKSRVRILPIDS